MKKKTLAAASLLLALLMPLGVTPLAVYADEAQMGISTVSEDPPPEGTVETKPLEWPDAADWTVSCSKIATDLDADYSSNVTLSLPSEQEQLVTEVCFVLDESTYSDTHDKALSLLSDLKNQASTMDAKIQVDVVGFKRRAQDHGSYDLESQYDAIVDAFTSQAKGGTNMQAGLLLAKEVLARNTSIPNSRKYMILISDGDTYLYCKNGDYNTPYSRSNIPFESAGGSSYGGFSANCWYYPSEPYDKNVGRPATSDPALWDKYLADVNSRNQESNGDQYDYIWNFYDEDWKNNPDKARATYKEMPREPRTADNMDMAFLYAAEVYKELASQYHCFSASVKSFNELDGGKTSFMGYLSGGTAATFSQIKKEIAYAVSAGSYVEDVIGDKFTLDVGSLSVSVDGKPLNKASISENSWTFSDDESTTDSYAVSYDPITKKIIWSINKPITNFARVRLSYKVKLSNPETIPNSYSALTNQWAKLYPKDSAGAVGQAVEFPQPEVSYTIYALNYDANGGNGAPDSVVNCTGKFTVSDTVPTRDGYVFAGWNTAPDGSGTNCAAGSGIEGNKDSPALTLYAQWNKLVTVSFDLCGHGGANIPSQTFVSGNKASEPTVPKEDGWVFGGWYTEKGCQYRFSFDSAVTSDITLYAKWDRVTTVVSAPVATPTPSPAPAAAATKTATVKNAAIPQTSDVFPMEGLLALLAVGAVGFGAAGWLRKKHH